MSTAVVKGGMPNTSELAVMKTMANELATSGLLPDEYKAKPTSVFAAIQLGRELGLQPMQAITGINVIKGKPSVSPALMAALIMNSGKGTYRVKQFTDKISEIVFTRDGVDTVMTFTIEDAQRAQLTNGVNWTKYPKNMLHARNMSNGARMIFPDVIQGLYTPEEIIPDVEMTEDGEPAQGQIVDLGAGQVVEAELVEEPKSEPVAPSEAENKELTSMILDLIKWYKHTDFLNTLGIEKRRNYQKVLADSEGHSVVDATIDIKILPSLLHAGSVRKWHAGIGKAYDTYDLTKGATNGK